MTSIYSIGLSALAAAAWFGYFWLIWRAKTGLDYSLDVVAAHGVGGTVGALLTGVFAQKALNELGNNGLLFGNPTDAHDQGQLNGAGGAISLRLADLRVERVAPADLVVANLTGALLVSLAPAIIDLVRPGGILVVSGFMAPEVDALRAVFEPALTHTGEAAEDAWRALRFDRAPLSRA